MEKFIFICGCIVLCSLIVWFVVFTIQCLILSIVRKREQILFIKNLSIKNSNDILVLNNRFISYKNNVSKELHKQNELITHLIKVINKKD